MYAPAIALVALLLPSIAAAAPAVLSQGRVLDPVGGAINGAHTTLVALYDAPSGGNLVWFENRPVSFEDGYYAVELGTVNPFDADDFRTDLWLELMVNGVSLLPRQRVGAVPIALSVRGRVQLVDVATCAASDAGTLRWDAANESIDVCTGEEWVTLQGFGSLYDFNSHTFTACGVTGRTGPTLAQCQSAYSTAWDENPAWYGMQTQGIQRWTVPATGRYRITARGASGGLSTNTPSIQPGFGAVMRGDFDLDQGEVLQILVGQEGQSVPRAGGAGGGTFVVKADGTALVVAGGGVGSVDGNAKIAMWDATTSTSGKNSNECTGGSGGSGANANCSGSYGGGGGGLLSAGVNGVGAATGGQGFANGGVGGNCDATCGSNAGWGGFGGGGGTYHDNRPGGAGGYSGGASGNEHAGGGGSYNVGSNPSNAVATGAGPGSVLIERL